MGVMNYEGSFDANKNIKMLVGIMKKARNLEKCIRTKFVGVCLMFLDIAK